MMAESRRIFVFGSNTAGRHGAGAAKTAYDLHGAVYGQGYGLEGNSFAIPTKDDYLDPLPIEDILGYVRQFIWLARSAPDLTFDVTRIGCGLAGYTDDQISPLFEGAPSNVILPKAWGGEGFDW